VSESAEPAASRPLFTFANNVHDRRSLLRADEAALQAAWDDDKSRATVVGGDHIATGGDALWWTPTSQAPAGERILLGALGGREHFAVMVDRVPDECSPQTLRELAPALAADEAGLAVHAISVAQWHRTHQHCARCGAPTAVAQAGHLRRCPACGAQHFPRTDPAVIMLVTDGDDRALLGRQPVWPEGRYSTLAGFVEPGESLEDAVRREIMEEAGVVVGEVTYAGSQPWPFPSSLMLGFLARAASYDIVVDNDEIEDARWFTRAEVTELTAAGGLGLPGTLSISRWLIESWHGGEITGAWR